MYRRLQLRRMHWDHTPQLGWGHSRSKPHSLSGSILRSKTAPEGCPEIAQVVHGKVSDQIGGSAHMVCSVYLRATLNNRKNQSLARTEGIVSQRVL